MEPGVSLLPGLLSRSRPLRISILVAPGVLDPLVLSLSNPSRPPGISITAALVISLARRQPSTMVSLAFVTVGSGASTPLECNRRSCPSKVSIFFWVNSLNGSFIIILPQCGSSTFKLPGSGESPPTIVNCEGHRSLHYKGARGVRVHHVRDGRTDTIHVKVLIPTQHI